MSNEELVTPFPAAVARWRADTPGCTHGLHLNNAGAGLMPQSVLTTMLQYLHDESQVGGYELADQRRDDIAAAYRQVARLIGAVPRNVALVENATVAVAQALSAFDLHPGAVVLTTTVDYSANQLMLLSLAQRQGVQVVRAADRPEGGVDPASVQALIDRHRPRLVLMTWVPTNSGLVQEAEVVGAVCAAAGVPFVLDACQAVGQLPIDVARLRCDFLAATARKFLRGPRGIGFLYVSDRMLADGRFPLYVDGRGATWTDADAFVPVPDARRFENWEFNYALVLGLGEAARYACDVAGTEALARTQALAAYLRNRLAALPDVRLLDRGKNPCAIVTLAWPGLDAGAAVQQLRTQHIRTSAAVRAFAVLDMDAKGVSSALRLSPHYYNTEQEIDQAVEALARLRWGGK
jgi:selenocysteine lyase/cysteine desulfurase